ncbi:MAG TPA: Gfo/Idh/MocA family oxidoreductase, partial [bacterium]|nr:Gfo/Idh/MocA family oxidoreductase [bacterium]
MTSSTLIHVGVIGAGRIGKVHAEHLACRISNARLAAVSDIDRAAAKACADRFHVTKVYSDAEPVLADSSIDAVAICSSTNTHAPLIEAAAAAGKHIFCEKPVDFDLERIDRCLRAVDKAGVKFQVGFNRRFDPNFWEVRRKITEGRVGDVQIVRITSRDPAPPPIDYIRVSGGMFL